MADDLSNDEAFISDKAVQIIKYHGTYLQHNREQRTSDGKKSHQFMIRIKMPGGEMPSSVYKVLDKLATEYGNDTMRATTRCSIQMHGVLKGDLKTVLSSIMNAGGSCAGTCGDLVSNVVCTPAPFTSKPYENARFMSRMLGELFAPQSGAFSEIWLDGEKAATIEYWKHDIDMHELARIMRHNNGNGIVFPGHEEPIYGDTYLPRKFKFGVTVPGDNSIDIYTQEVGIVCIPDETGRIIGYNVLVGGGMGRAHNNGSTYARTADHLGYVSADRIFELCKAIVAVQRDYGNRSNRSLARLKYVVNDMGIDVFRWLVENYFGEEIEPFKEMKPWKYEDWLGWHEQGDGKLFLGIFVENGRIQDNGEMRLKTALRKIAETHNLDFVVSPNQNVILRNIKSSEKSEVEALLRQHGVKMPEDYSQNQLLSMACPALPLCGLAVTEAERVMPALVENTDKIFSRYGVGVPVAMRMTGCFRGCTRPYMAELAFVGSGKGEYQIWLGGNSEQTRLGWLHLDCVKTADLEGTVENIVATYAANRMSTDEPFGDFCVRVGSKAIKSFCDSR